MAWNPFGVLLEISATGGTVKRTSATQFTVVINAAWETYYSGAQTNYGMTASSGGVTKTLNPFGTKSSGDSVSFTGTYSISGNGSATKAITVTFRNFNNDNGDSATKSVSFNVTVPAWTSYTVSYNANGGTGAPASQTKWKDQTLTLSTTKPTRAGHSFLGWSTSSTATSATYAAGANYTANAAATLYAVWKANTYTVSYNANGGTGAPASQTKTYGKTLTLSSAKPTRQNYNFVGWGTSASATTVSYAAGASYTGNAALTLYAIWELAYRKPRITNFIVERYNSTAADVSFSWACDQPPLYLHISWTDQNGGSFGSESVRVEETSGTYSGILGENLSPEMSYTFHIIAVDGGEGRTTTYKNLNTEKYLIDFSADGVAFGKTAELVNTAEFAFDGKFSGAVYGRALGMDRLPEPESTDFNECLTTGCYAVHSNAIAATCSNMPVARAGRLEVWAATGEGVRLEQWSYIRQRYIPYNSENAVWERDITRGENNAWTYYDWYKSSLTPAASEKVYSKAAMTIALSANNTLGVYNSYTRIPFDVSAVSTSDRLTLSENSIRIGKNISYVKASATFLLRCGTVTGNRHFRIQKISNGTTSSFAWFTHNANASANTMCSISPIIIPVKEGDLIFAVFYTGDTADSIVSGSSTNGRQSYLTVEEL